MITINEYPYLIAEAGVAHFGSMAKALDLLKSAVDAKCDAFKIQVFSADILFANEARGWKKRLKDRVLKIEEIIQISKLCEEANIDFIITPHDEYILPHLNDIKIKALKIGSGEVGNLLFISKCLDYCDHLIYSTGLSDIKDIDNIVALAKSKNKELSILHCNTSYPTKDNEVNLSVIKEFSKKYKNCKIGYSDHTPDHLACINSICFGAKIIERHITLEKNIPNAQDWKVASLPDELKELRKSLNRAYDQIGFHEKVVTESAKENIYWACKSPYLKRNVKKDEFLTIDCYEMKRPFTGTRFEDINNENEYIFSEEMSSGSPINLSSLKFNIN